MSLHSTFTGIQYKKPTHNTAEHLRLHETCCREVPTFLLSASGTVLLYACAVHSYDFFKVMNTKIKPVHCITEHTIAILWFTDLFLNLVFCKLN